MKSMVVVAFAVIAVGGPARAEGRRLRDLGGPVAAVAEKMFRDFPPRH